MDWTPPTWAVAPAQPEAESELCRAAPEASELQPAVPAARPLNGRVVVEDEVDAEVWPNAQPSDMPSIVRSVVAA